MLEQGVEKKSGKRTKWNIHDDNDSYGHGGVKETSLRLWMCVHGKVGELVS
jgi:hypothetical protein